MVLQLLLAAAAPSAIRLSAESEQALGSGRVGRRQCHLMQWAELQAGAQVLPALSGCLVDRWGNRTLPPPCLPPGALAPLPRGMLLVAYERPADGAAGGGAPAEVPMYLVAASDVAAQEGTFALPPVALAGEPLQTGRDYDLYLQLSDEQDPGRPGELSELVRTLYVCNVADSAQLHEQVSRLEAEIASAQAVETGCRSDLRNAEYARRAAERDVAERGQELATALGVALPSLEQMEAELEAAAAEAAGMAAAGAGYGPPPQQRARRAVQHEQAVAAAVSRLADQEAALAGSYERGVLVRYQPQQRYQPPPQQQQQQQLLQSVCVAPALARVTPNAQVDESTNRQYQRLRSIADASFGVPGALGPLVMLGAVECAEVSDALAYLSRGSLDKLYVIGRTALDTVKSRLRQLGAGSALDLSNGSLERFYELDVAGTDTSHPQRPLLKRDMRNKYQDVLNFDVTRSALDGRRKPQGAREQEDHGFIGFAVNLIHLPPHLAEVQVPTSRGPRNLRQTLMNRIFANAMVFDTEDSVTAFQRRCEQRGLRIEVPVIAADGRGGLNLGGIGEEQFGLRSRMNVRYSGMPPDQVTPLVLAPPPPQQQQHLLGGALDLRLRTEQVRVLMMRNQCARLQALGTEVGEALQRLRVCRGMEATRSHVLAQRQQQLQPQLADLQRQLAEARGEYERVRQRERQQQAAGGGGAAGGGADAREPVERHGNGGGEGGGVGDGGGAGGQNGRRVRFGRLPAAQQPQPQENGQHPPAGGGAAGSRKRAAADFGGKGMKRPR
ncbi:hypothetical protein HXX76_012835 [Chlamydomonas incerta]|uniref:Uncharacterized protein n=1 Tax=Chlamydomonas incerta TaxID=51695 RepID=A0A835VUX2_CHLIN|nr:hypothetical protein HXX76_012835 [Chlamydomonas incerta]|eukprot:KAG2426778.1 hypothetical protein HXX76_012835 [Chlamydomonas incerta]